MPRLETRYGLLDVPETQHDLIGKHLALDGEWAWLETQFISTILPSAASVLDVGAFVGTFGIGLRRARPDIRIAFVEANCDIVPLLTSNVQRLVGFDSPVIHALVAGNHSQFSPAQAQKDNMGSTFFRRKANIDDDCFIDSLTLSDVRSTLGFFDFLKLDVEGLEAEIIESDLDYLVQPTVSVWIECNEQPEALNALDSLFRLAKPVYYFAWPAHWRGNWRDNKKPVFPWAFEAGLLATHIEPCLTAELSENDCVLAKIQTTADLREALWQTPRWGHPDWLGKSRANIVALAGRHHREEVFDHFLDQGYSPPPLMSDRLAASEAALHNAEKLAFSKQDDIDALEQRLTLLQGDLADARARQLQAEQIAASYNATSLENLSLLDTKLEEIRNLERRLVLLQREAESAKAQQAQAERLASSYKTISLEHLSMLGTERRQHTRAREKLEAAQSSIRTSHEDSENLRSLLDLERSRIHLTTMAMQRATLDAQTRSERIAVLEHELRELRRSSSWLITAPMRRIASARWIRTMFRRFRSIIARIFGRSR